MMTNLSAREYQQAIDDDPIPWHRFPNCPEEDKTLSYLTVNGEELKVPLYAETRDGDFTFRGGYGTNFPPPGLEDDFDWRFKYAEHPAPGLAHPSMSRHLQGAPSTPPRPIPSAVRSSQQMLCQTARFTTKHGAIESDGLELAAAIRERREPSLTSLPPTKTIPPRSTSSLEPILCSTTTDADHEGLTIDSLMRLMHLMRGRELDATVPVSSDLSTDPSEHQPKRHRLSQLQECSNDNLILSSALNTPDRVVSNKTSGTSLTSAFNSSQS